MIVLLVLVLLFLQFGNCVVEFYVDSAIGNDSNDGRSLASPLQSFGGVSQLLNSTKLLRANLTANFNFNGEFSGASSCGARFLLLSSMYYNVTFRPTNESDFVRLRCDMTNHTGSMLYFLLRGYNQTLSLERFDLSDMVWSIDECDSQTMTGSSFCEMSFLKIQNEQSYQAGNLRLSKFRINNNLIRRVYIPTSTQG